MRSNKKIPAFRVTRPYLDLLVKPRFFFSSVLEKNIILGEMPFKMHKITYFFQKKKIKNMCAFHD